MFGHIELLSARTLEHRSRRPIQFDLTRKAPSTRMREAKRHGSPTLGGSGHWGQASTMMRSSVMSSIAQRRPSRPSPESFTPPYGM